MVLEIDNICFKYLWVHCPDCFSGLVADLKEAIIDIFVIATYQKATMWQYESGHL